MSDAEKLRDSYALAESIASRDLNNLYLTSRFFADPLRYRTFCVYYAVMRVVDDQVDDLAARREVPEDEVRRVRDEVGAWRRALRRLLAGTEDPRASADCAEPTVSAGLLVAFQRALEEFPVPQSLWENFFDAMERDLRSPRFDSYSDFLEYAEGATVAPTTIYLDLLAAQETGPSSGRYALPRGFDLLECGRQLGRFAYLVHILRDLPKDLTQGASSLIYLARDDMETFGVTDETLRDAVAQGSAGARLRSLLEELGRRARRHLEAGRELTQPLEGEITPDCKFVLELIISLYEEILRRIAAQGFDPFPGRHRLSLREKANLAVRTARRVGFSLDAATVLSTLRG